MMIKNKVEELEKRVDYLERLVEQNMNIQKELVMIIQEITKGKAYKKE